MSPRAVDGKRLMVSRPTPPCRLLLRHASRDVIQCQQLSWRRIERSQSLDQSVRRRHVPGRECHRQRTDDGQTDKQNEDSCTGHGHHYEADVTSQCDDQGAVCCDDTITDSQRTVVDHDVALRPDTGLRRHSGDLTVDRRQRHRHQKQQQIDADKKRRTSSGVMVDFSALLRRMRRLRVDRQHETPV